MLSDEAIQRILERATEEEFSKACPAAAHFFRSKRAAGTQPRTVAIHKWVFATVEDADSAVAVHALARTAVKEVMSTSTQLTAEVVFGYTKLLPFQPVWLDAAALFSRTSEIDGSNRFGVIGGNVVESVGCFADDVAAAVDRLAELDPHGVHDSDEKLQIFCAKPLEKKLIRASAKARAKCRVFGIWDHKTERSWVLARASSPCSMVIGKPTIDIPVKGTNIVVGARFEVWIDNPRLAVYVED